MNKQTHKHHPHTDLSTIHTNLNKHKKINAITNAVTHMQTDIHTHPNRLMYNTHTKSHAHTQKKITHS